MFRPAIRNTLILIGCFLLAWAAVRYLLPLTMPFLLGTALALIAEPAVSRLTNGLRWKRGLATAIGMTGVLVLLLALLVLLTSFLLRELGALAGILPDLSNTARQGMGLLQDFLLGLVSRTPAGVRPVLTESVLRLFGSGNSLMNRMVAAVSAMASGILLRVPDGALSAATAILSAYMISTRLPRIRAFFHTRLPKAVYTKAIPAWQRMKEVITGWLKAQVKLSCVSCAMLIVGFLLLRIPYAPLWGMLTSLVDALPVLGTGTVLLPWALVCLLQGNTFLAIGLLGLYAAVSVTRSALEPRLVGKQLGIDPLVTLVALYLGYQLWGLLGMLLSPLLAVAVTELTLRKPQTE